MSTYENLLGGPAPTYLPDTPEATALLADGTDPAEVAARFPAQQLPWALLAERALADGQPVQAYAFARTGYHRGLDALRRSGWKGHGPVPWSHEPNQGWLRAVAALARAAAAIGETAEEERCRTLLADSDPEAATELA